MGDAATPLLSFPSRSILIFILVGLIIPQVLLCEGDDNVHYTQCRHSFNCGTVTNITILSGEAADPNSDEYPIFEYQEQTYRVLKIDQHLRMMTIARMDLMDVTCLGEFRNTSMMDSTLFHMTPAVRNLSIFYGCLITWKNISDEFECLYGNLKRLGFFMEDNFLNRKFPFNLTICLTSIKVPVIRSALDDIRRGKISLREALNRGFDLECLACTSSSRFCGSNFTCYCCDKPCTCTYNDPGMFF
ncbi:hypothetical protein ACJRO7_009973 [Eucalyptus globulus]|uniref:Uncharacterized protein n=1 Tax=Eucalyptus globulus TaxID=34317 RepID=A0ABD3LAH6_EUCGL